MTYDALRGIASERSWRDDRPLIDSPSAAAAILGPMIAGRDREQAALLSLTTKHRLIRASVVSVGSIDHTFMQPREILRDALLDGAAAIVVAHNHPSGDPTPSDDDRIIARRLADACALIGVDLLDALTLGATPDAWISAARERHI